jgi:hypothetical protein
MPSKARRSEGGFLPMRIRRLLLFVRTYRKARKLGFTLVDAMRAAMVNSKAA